MLQEKEGCQALARELEEERRRALRMEARVEEQLAEFDTEREQLRSRLKKEEAHCCQLQLQVSNAVINSHFKHLLPPLADTDLWWLGGKQPSK